MIIYQSKAQLSIFVALLCLTFHMNLGSLTSHNICHCSQEAQRANLSNVYECLLHTNQANEISAGLIELQCDDDPSNWQVPKLDNCPPQYR